MSEQNESGKEEFQLAEDEVIWFESEDIITDSNVDPDGWTTG